MRTRKPTHPLWALAATIAAALATVPAAGAHPPGPTLSGYGTPVIDGVIGAGEWDAAARYAFSAAVPANDGGGTVPATLYVMNDSVSLYVALEVRRSGPPRGSFSVEFGNDHDGQLFEDGDDAFVANPGAAFFDAFRSSQPPCPPNVVATTQAPSTGTGDIVVSDGSDPPLYPFSGFLATLENPPVLNDAHSDGVQMVWFRLGGDRGLGAVSDVSSRRIDCARRPATWSPR